MSKSTLDMDKATLRRTIYSCCYGACMRILHAIGGHWYGKPTGPDMNTLWCYWCGDRRPAKPRHGLR